MTPDDASDITVSLGSALIARPGTDGLLELSSEPGWKIFGGVEPYTWMVERRDLPEDWPLLARAACELLRRFGEFTPQQRACANACMRELGA